jgi:hypothetical protein
MALPLNNIFLYLQSNDLESNPRNGTWNDLSGNDYDFTTVSTPPNFGANSNLQSTLDFFNGSQMTRNETFADYIIGTLPWTWEMFVIPTSGQTNQWLFSTVDDAENGGFGIKTNQDNGTLVSFMIGGSPSPVMDYNGGHYVWVRDANSNIRQYLNGVLQSTWTIGSGVIPPSVLGYSVISRRTLASGNYMGGSYGIIRGWDVALTGAQVEEAYQDVIATLFPQKITSFDFSDPLCYNGTGTVVNNLGGYFPLDITNVTFIPNGQSSRMHFNGVVSYLSALGIPTIGNTFTVNFWGRYTQNNATYQPAFSAGRLNSTGQGPLLQFNEPGYGQFTASMNFGAKGTVTAGGFSPLDWNFISYTCDGTTAKLYVNGVLQGSDAQDSTSWLSGAFAMGTRVNSTGSAVVTDQTFEGDIAKLDVYNVALGSTALLDQYNAEYSRFYGLIASYDLSDVTSYPGTGNTIFDTIGANDLTIYGGPPFTSDGQASYLALNDPQVPGSTDYAAKLGILDLDKNPWTISLWYNPIDNAYSPEMLWSYGFNVNPSNFAGLWKDKGSPANVIALEFGDNDVTTSTTPTIDWHNIIVSTDAGNATIYFDGSSIGSTVITTGQVYPGSIFGIGGLIGSSVTQSQLYSRMKLGLCQVYNVGLDASEALALFNSQSSRFIAPPETDLKVSYDLSDVDSYPGTGNTVFDLSQYGNDLTLFNSPSFSSSGQSSYLAFNSASSQYGQISSISGISTTPFTFNMWFAPTLYDNDGGSYLTFADTSTFDDPFIISYVSPGNQLAIGSLEGFVQPTRPPLYNWANIIATVDASNVLTAYLNGSSVGSTTMTGFNVDASPGLIISSFVSPSFGDIKLGLFEGYNVAFGSTAVTDLYNSQVSRFPQPPPYEGSVGGRQFGQGFNG